jgi:hypothetical protein
VVADRRRAFVARWLKNFKLLAESVNPNRQLGEVGQRQLAGKSEHDYYWRSVAQ